MSTTFTIDSSTSRATPVSAPMKRVTVPAVLKRKGGEPLVMLTAYTVRTAQLFDPHCDLLLVGDSLGQVIYGLPSTVPVSLEMMAAHGAAVVRGSYHAMVVVDMPFGSYETSPEKAFESASWPLNIKGAQIYGRPISRLLRSLLDGSYEAQQFGWRGEPEHPTGKSFHSSKVALSLLLSVIDHKSEEGPIKAFRTSRRELITAISAQTGYRSSNNSPQA